MVTVMAGVIAMLGTSIAFLSSDSLNSFFGNIGETFDTSSKEDSNHDAFQQPSQEQSNMPVEEQANEENEEEEEKMTEGQFEEIAEPSGTECEVLDISDEYPVLYTGEECFKVSNVQTWVNKVSGRINERSTTAFVLENTGTKMITIDRIVLSDIPVPESKWFYTTDPTVVKPANIQKDLPVDYTESVVTIGGGIVFMNPGKITLEPAQRAIVYLDEAGGVIERDVGMYLTLQVQTGQLQVEKAVLVVRA